MMMVGETLAQGPPKTDAKLLAVGGDKQLFIDELFFEESRGIRLRVHPARKTRVRNVVSEHPWESATLNWFNVLDDGGKCRMWYECYDVDGWPTGDDTSFCYAESADGIHWTKPKLGLVSYQDSGANNILFRQIGPQGARSRVHGTGVFRDPNAPPERRYKAVSQGLFRSPRYKRPHRIAGMCSADGLHWTRYPTPVCEVFADSQDSAFWDDQLKKYVLYGRVPGGGMGRAESDDFAHFAPLQPALLPDGKDPAGSSLYNPAALKYPYAANVYLMFPSLFRHAAQTLDIRLAVSRDGVHWTRPERVPFIRLGDQGDFDSASLYMGQGVIRKADELWQYYSGSSLKHNEVKLETLVKLKPGEGRSYSRVVTRLDGYVSADADESGGAFTTPPLTFRGDTLTLNVQTRDGGALRVGLLDDQGNAVEGRSVDECHAITGDHIRAVVRWRSGADVSTRSGLPTKMRFEMKNASLYAFRFSRGAASQGRER